MVWLGRAAGPPLDQLERELFPITAISGTMHVRSRSPCWVPWGLDEPSWIEPRVAQTPVNSPPAQHERSRQSRLSATGTRASVALMRQARVLPKQPIYSS